MDVTKILMCVRVHIVCVCVHVSVCMREIKYTYVQNVSGYWHTVTVICLTLTKDESHRQRSKVTKINIKFECVMTSL